jgi:zinc protease
MLRPLYRLVVLTFVMLVTGLSPAFAVDVKEVKTPKGITAWLVEDKTVPLIAMNFSFAGGGALDPEGKEGLSHFLTGMLDEGAGPLDAAAFQARRDELAMRLSFDSGLDHFEGRFETLSANRDQAFGLLRLAVTFPRFEQGPLDRVRNQFLIGAQQNLEDPERIASTAWMATGLGSHPYARETEGSPQSIAAIAADDLKALHARLFTRSSLKVAVVGDIDAETLARLLDETFGGLPDTPPPEAPQKVAFSNGPSLKVIERDIPQSIIMFGHDGILRTDEDFIPAFVMSFILGGGGFGSRLTEEVREKRGLTYGIGAGLYPLDQAGLFLGSVGTRNEKAKEAIDIVKDVIKRFSEEGPSGQELADAKTYLIGSYALRFDSNTKIAGQLLGLQQDNLGIDYINTRNSKIEAVTLEQVKEQARRLLHADKLTITIVGKPVGVAASGTSG